MGRAIMIMWVGQGILLLSVLLSIFCVWRPHAATFYTLIACICMSFLLLLTAFLLSDFSLHLVVQHSHSLKPLFYKITATWANHEGSMLMAVMQMAIAGGIGLAAFPYLAILRVHALLLTAFLAYIFFVSNPFLPALTLMEEGRGLNPLLQDFGLAIHPPVLYAGYACVSLLFSLTIWSCGAVPRAIWLPAIKQVTHIGLAFLTAGIALGSWWAYRELGWGGVWFWDPVENISLVPWLCLLALLHVLHLAKAGQFLMLTRWLSGGTFVLVLLGFFVVRSGLLSSVHSFATSPARGIWLGCFAFAVLLFFLWRMVQCSTVDMKKPVPQKAAHLLLSLAILLIILLIMVLLLGIAYPILSTVFGAPAHVGVEYYSHVFASVAVLLLLLCLITPWLRLRQLCFTAKMWRMHLAHTGGLVLLCGALLYTVFSSDAQFLAMPHQPQKQADDQIMLTDVVDGSGANYAYRRAHFVLNQARRVTAERRIYIPSGTITHEAGIEYGVLVDKMVIIGNGDAQAGIAVRYYVRYGVSLFWIGALLMIGGVWPRKKSYSQ